MSSRFEATTSPLKYAVLPTTFRQHRSLSRAASDVMVAVVANVRGRTTENGRNAKERD
jgi:hypothetical protein